MSDVHKVGGAKQAPASQPVKPKAEAEKPAAASPAEASQYMAYLTGKKPSAPPAPGPRVPRMLAPTVGSESYYVTRHGLAKEDFQKIGEVMRRLQTSSKFGASVVINKELNLRFKPADVAKPFELNVQPFFMFASRDDAIKVARHLSKEIAPGFSVLQHKHKFYVISPNETPKVKDFLLLQMRESQAMKKEIDFSAVKGPSRLVYWE